MHSSLIGKVEKAKRYAQEPDRVTLSEFSADFRGEHDNYTVTYRSNNWHCTCKFFAQWETCSHIMALQRLFSGVLPVEASTSLDTDITD